MTIEIRSGPDASNDAPAPRKPSVRPRLPNIEFSFVFRGERWITRLGDGYAKPIEVFLDNGHLHKIAAQLTTQLSQYGVSIAAVRAAIDGGPLAILLDRILAIKPKTKRSER